MHGIVFLELRKFVEAGFGRDGWMQILKKADIGEDLFMPSKTYPDHQIVSIVMAACEITGKSAHEILDAFGKFIVPDLIGIYGSFIDPKWTMIDMIENVDTTIHRIVRMKNAGADPPELSCTRLEKNKIEITYKSNRKMCAFAKGLVAGLADHYSVKATVTETLCMHNGDAECRMQVVTT